MSLPSTVARALQGRIARDLINRRTHGTSHLALRGFSAGGVRHLHGERPLADLPPLRPRQHLRGVRCALAGNGCAGRAGADLPHVSPGGLLSCLG